MKDQTVVRDERTILIENASYRWAYLLLANGLLVIVAYRGLMRRESSWDLLALIVLSGFVTMTYQRAHRVLSRRWALVTCVTMIVAAAVAMAIALLHR
jgi:hypothetical protein